MFQHTCGHVTTAQQNEALWFYQGTDDRLKSGGGNDPFDDMPKKHTALLNIKSSV